MSRHLTANYGHLCRGCSYSSSGGCCQQSYCWNLAGRLHSFILHWCDVFKARRRHVPIFAGPFLPRSSRRVAVLLVVSGGAAAIPALPVPATAAFLPAAATSVFAPAAMLVTSSGRSAATPLLVPLPLSLLSILAQLFLKLLEIRHDVCHAAVKRKIRRLRCV